MRLKQALSGIISKTGNLILQRLDPQSSLSKIIQENPCNGIVHVSWGIKCGKERI